MPESYYNSYVDMNVGVFVCHIESFRIGMLTFSIHAKEYMSRATANEEKVVRRIFINIIHIFTYYSKMSLSYILCNSAVSN